MNNLNNQGKIAIIILLLLMIASTFIGVPLNGGAKGWIYLYDIEYELIRGCLKGAVQVYMPRFMMILLAIQCIVHLSIIVLPFLMGSKRFFSWLVAIPLLYIILQAATFFYFLILLIPFAVLWIVALIVWKNNS